MNNPKILSIAIPAYNMEQYLARSLDSILNIDFVSDLDVLIVNDGSKDRTLDIAKKYESRYSGIIRVVDKKNGGWGSAINMAISLASGKYFKILDADDWYDSSSFQTFIAQLKEIDCDLVLTPYCFEYVAQGLQKEASFRNVAYNKKYEYTDLLSLNWGNDWFELPSITYRTALLQNNNIKVTECFYSDIEYDYLPIKYVRSFIFLPFSIYRYYIGREGQSVSPEGVTKHYEDHLHITKNVIDHFLNTLDCKDNVYSNFIKGVTVAKIIQNYQALLIYYTDRKTANILLSQFDSYLVAKSKYLYNHVGCKLSKYHLIYPILLWRYFRYNIYQSYLYKFIKR